ncbi:MAG: CARDB domain-containing protein [Candidatus Woesearchaeota archaeon]
MTKLTKNDYVNLSAFGLMITLVLVSWISSDFFPEGGITGAVIMQHTNEIVYNVNYISTTGENEYYVDVPILFSVQIRNETNNVYLRDSLCQITINNKPSQNMQYNSNPAIEQYEAFIYFDEIGQYTFNISCDMSAYNTSNINKIDTIHIKESLPDLSIEISNPGSTSKGSEIEITLRIRNIGFKQYNGEVEYNINFGDGNVLLAKKANINSQEIIVTEKYKYNTTGNKNITVEINPNRKISEKNYSNNNAHSTIFVSDPVIQPFQCGAITTSTELTKNENCLETIYFINENIVLDCKNYKIFGNNKQDNNVGIYAGNPVTIKNCLIENYGTGILAEENITLINSTIRNTKTGLTLKNTNNNIRNNTFINNDLAIKNFLETRINKNDFIGNTFNIETDLNLDFKYNFFGTIDYKAIESKIKTQELVTVIPYMDKSVRDPTSTEIEFDNIGPTFNITIKSAVINYQTSYNVEINSNKFAECRISDNTIEFDKMNIIPSLDGLKHTILLRYNEQKELQFRVLCANTNGYLSNLHLSGIYYNPSALELTIDKLGEEIELAETRRNNAQDRRNSLQRELDINQNPEIIERLKIDIKEYEIDIELLNKLINNADNLRKDLTTLNNEINNINENYINNYRNDIIEINERIKELEDTIKNKKLNKVEDIDVTFNDLFERINQKYNLMIQKNNKNHEKQQILNRYDALIIKKSLDDLQDEITKFKELNKLGKNDYRSTLDQLEIRLSITKDEFDDATETEKINNLELENKKLKENRVIYQQYTNNILNIIREINEAISYSIEKDYYLTEDKLRLLLDYGQRKMDENQIRINNIDDEIIANEEKIKEIINPERIILNKNTIILNLENNNIKSFKINESNFLITEILVTVQGGTSSRRELYLSELNSNPYPSERLYSFNWFNITLSPGIELIQGDIQFEIASDVIKLYEIATEDISLYLHNNEWIKMPTAILEEEHEEQEYENIKFRSIINQLGIYAIGFDLIIEDDDNDCESNWECNEEWSWCENNIQKRTCVDLNECKADREEERECEQHHETCYDGIQNQNEEGIDCGGVCPYPCPDEESPSRTIRTDKSISPILTIIIILFVILGVAGLAIEFVYLPKKKKKKEEQEAGEVDNYEEEQETKQEDKEDNQEKETKDKKTTIKQSDFNYKIIDQVTEKLFRYEDMEKIKQEFMLQGIPKEQIIYTLHLTNYVFSKIQNTPTKEIISELKSKNWSEVDAKHIVEYITIRYLYHQITEFITNTEDQSEIEIVKESFRTDGFNDRIINKAFDIFQEKNSNDENNL